VSVFVKATNPHSAEEAPRFEETEVAACLNGWDERHNPPKHMAVAFANRTRDGVKVPEVMPDGITPALTNPGNGGRADAINVVAVDTYNQTEHSTAQPVRSTASDVDHTGGVINPAERMAVRRLTPRECERLQGFPDDHTLIPWRGKPADQCPDGPRYKALGNSMAVPCMEWIGQRIAAQEMFPLRYLSVCSGIEAASVAWEPLGWQPAAFAEVERFPSAVLAHHWPDVPNLGDMTQYEQWKELGAIDLLVGGTPCQSFSVAGLRQGLRDPRGGLMLTYLEIATSFRPRWLVWENVPGVLSSHGGRDFGAFLGALGALGYGWAYRVLDAQWFGVAQRRRRVFVVANLGDGAAAAKVLFESESVRRNPAPSREAGQRTAATLVRGSKRSGGIGYDNQALFSQSGDNFVRPSDYPETVGTLSDGAHNGGGLNGQDAYSGRIFAVSAPAAHNTTQ
jgi:site-specific DNA-cytosine methylase